MKKFQIETLFIALGILLVLSMVGKQCWEQNRFCRAEICTQGCNSTSSGACVGNDSLPKCTCASQTSGTIWSNAVTRVSTLGSSSVSMNSVHCKSVTPCVVSITHTGIFCDMALVLPACTVIMPGGTCSVYGSGTPNNYTSYDCSVSLCEE
jgi:hypothetical protein